MSVQQKIDLYDFEKKIYTKVHLTMNKRSFDIRIGSARSSRCLLWWDRQTREFEIGLGVASVQADKVLVSMESFDKIPVEIRHMFAGVEDVHTRNAENTMKTKKQDLYQFPDVEEFYLTIPGAGARTFHFRRCPNKGRGSYNAKDGQRFARVTDALYRSENSGETKYDIMLTDFDGKIYQYNGGAVTITTEKPAGMKYSKGKPRFSLLPIEMVWEVVDILEFGAEKYGVENWKSVENARTEYYNALHRHLRAWAQGETRDEDSKKLHMAHVACNAFFLGWLDLFGVRGGSKPPISK